MTNRTDLPERLRVFELAKRLDVPAAELLARLQGLDVDVNTVLKAIDRAAMQRVLEDYRAEGGLTAGPSPQLVDDLLSGMNGSEAKPEPGETPQVAGLDALATGDHANEAEVDPDHQSSGEIADPQVIRLSAVRTPDAESDLASSLPETEPDPSEGALSDEAGETSPDTAEPAPENGATHRYGRPSGWSAWSASSRVDDPVEVGDARTDPDTQMPEEEKPQDDTDDGREPVRLRDANDRWLATNPRSRILMVGAAILAGTVMLTLVYALLRPTYAAESDIVINLSGLGSEEIQRELQSFSVVAGSQTVLAPVAEQFEISVPDLRDSFSSSIVGDSTVLRFTTAAGEPDMALALNEAVVESYLEVANQPADQDELAYVESRVSEVEESIATIDSQLESLQADEAAQTATRLQIETDRSVAQSQLANLEDTLVGLRASGSPPAGSISFIEGQINETEARLGDLVAEAQALESSAAATTSEANRLREERTFLRSEMQDFESLRVDLELGEIRGNRVAVLAPAHVADDPVGLTPTRAVALGLLVGGALAFAWVVGATQLRRKR